MKGKCLFCKMRTDIRFLGLRMCVICRDQSYDFLWVTLIQSIVWILGGISSLFFVLDELLLFIVLVLVKHRITPPWEAKQR